MKAKKYLTSLTIILLICVLLFSLILNILLIADISNFQHSTSTLKNDTKYSIDSGKVNLAKDIVERGGYILYFRHGHREKWIDVAMYDAREATNDLDANELYFKNAVCLSDMGAIQVRMMGEFIDEIDLPVGELITSPSCRARQTSEGLFGRVGEIDNLFMHPGPYNENLLDFKQSVKERISGLEVAEGTNSVISAHNNVISAEVFDEMQKTIEFNLEEGGFYVMKKMDDKLVLIDKFHNYNDFNQIFFERPE